MLNVHGIQLNAHYTVTLPVSIGTLWAYITTQEDIYQHLNFTGFTVYQRTDTVLDLLEGIDKNGVPDVILVSLYMWNRNRSNKLTKAIKQKWPHVTIVVGGNDVPQHPDRFEQFVKDNPQYDYYVNSEGEIPLENILRKILSDRDIYKSTYLDDCFHIAKNGTVISKSKTKRYLNHKGDLDFPSACAIGLYDELVASLPDVELQGVLETNRGCPYSCTFCDWGLEEKMRKFSMRRIQEEIDWYVGNVHEIMVSDANFGILQRDIDIAKYLIKSKILHIDPKIHSTAITYAKNNKERVVEIAEILEKFDFSRSGATFSLQSLNDPTLVAIRRDNMSIAKDFDWIATNFTNKGIPYYHEMIMGMPLETKETFLAGMSKLLCYNPLEINVYKLAWLENSEMGLDNHTEQYQLEWAKFEQGPSIHDDEKEYAFIIDSTSTISNNDMQYIRNIRDLIQILWLGKSLFYVGRYLQQEYNIDACDIIENFYKYTTVDNTNDYWNTLYLSKEDAIRDSERHNVPLWYNYGKDRFKFTRYTNAWLYIHGSIERKNYFYQELEKFFQQYYPQLDHNLLSDLIKFNKNILIDGEQLNLNHCFETEYSWIQYFTNKELIKIPTTYNTKIEVAGNAKIPSSIGKEKFLYYVAGGHEFMFNKQNAFGYPEGSYNNADQTVNFISRVGTFFPADTYFDSADDVIKDIFNEIDPTELESTLMRLKVSKNIDSNSALF